MFRARRVGPFALALAAAEVVAAYVWTWVQEAFVSDLRGPDFFTYYAIARLQLVAGPSHVYDLGLQKQFQDQVTAQWSGHFILLPHILPPYFTLLLAPLGLLSFRGAYIVWTLVSAACVAGGVAAALRAAGIAGRRAALLVLLAAAYLPTFVLLLQGQSDGPAILGLGLSALAWTRGRYGAAGAAAALTLGKPHLLLLLPMLFLVRRSWRALGAYLGSAALLIAVSLPFFGVEGWRDYLHLVAPWLFSGYPGFPVETQSLFSVRGVLDHLPIGAGVSLAVLAALTLGVALAVALGDPRPRLDFALAVSASVALAAYAHTHDLVLLLVPSLLLAGLLLDRQPVRLKTGWAALAFSYMGVDLYLQLGAVPAAAGVIALAAYLLSERLTRAAPEPRLWSPSHPTPLESKASAAALPR
jgi:Glycosyltransferase family 87